MSYAQPFDPVRSLLLDLYAADDPTSALVAAFESRVFFGVPVTDLAAWFPSDGTSFAAPGDVASEDERLGLIGRLGEVNVPSVTSGHDKTSKEIRWNGAEARLGYGFVDASGFSAGVLAARDGDQVSGGSALLVALGNPDGPLEHLVRARLGGSDPTDGLDPSAADIVGSIVRYYCGVAFERLPPAA